MAWAVRPYPACIGAARVPPLGFLLSSQAAASPSTSCLVCTCKINTAVSAQSFPLSPATSGWGWVRKHGRHHCKHPGIRDDHFHELPSAL